MCLSDLSEKMFQKLLGYLRTRLPREWNLFIEEGEVILRKRELTPLEGAHVVLHCLNSIEGDAVEAIKSLLKIEGEICCSFIGDNLFSNQREFVAVLLKGEMVDFFDYDCWSNVDLLGRRYSDGRGSPDRSEMWVIPSEVELETVVVSSESLAKQFREAGLPVLIASSRGLGKEYTEEEEDEEILFDDNGTCWVKPRRSYYERPWTEAWTFENYRGY